jgi:hypothetical protein
MPFSAVGAPFQARDTIGSNTPGKMSYSEYVSSAGVNTGEPQYRKRVFNNTGGALVTGAVYMVAYGAAGKNPQIIACAAVTANCYVCVATEAAADQTWTDVVMEGVVDAMVEGTTDVAAADFLKIVAATDADAFIKDGTTKTTDSFAIALAAQAANSAVLTKVWLTGEIGDID